MLNILEGFDSRRLGFGTADYFHLIAEVLKIGFADRNACTGDPAFVDIPMERLTSKRVRGRPARARSARIARAISPGRRAGTGAASTAAHTTHVTTADAGGNVVGDDPDHQQSLRLEGHGAGHGHPAQQHHGALRSRIPARLPPSPPASA